MPGRVALDPRYRVGFIELGVKGSKLDAPRERGGKGFLSRTDFGRKVRTIGSSSDFFSIRVFLLLTIWKIGKRRRGRTKNWKNRN